VYITIKLVTTIHHPNGDEEQEKSSSHFMKLWGAKSWAEPEAGMKLFGTERLLAYRRFSPAKTSSQDIVSFM